MGVVCVATLPVPSGAECHSPYAQPENLRFLLVESYREKIPYLAKWLEDKWAADEKGYIKWEL